ncbi:hypothetical protein EVAR_9037_1 [Eumeta japonica]|uniref:Uncharacterized protein n=1 Tax=Eumeta variegata TaxID=151549 RepID=A0A4C1TVW9_EUMVA|nr:hypothetical protein EVAR_9037_1 [Eumeta japonica]
MDSKGEEQKGLRTTGEGNERAREKGNGQGIMRERYVICVRAPSVRLIAAPLRQRALPHYTRIPNIPADEICTTYTPELSPGVCPQSILIAVHNRRVVRTHPACAPSALGAISFQKECLSLCSVHSRRRRPPAI